MHCSTPRLARLITCAAVATLAAGTVGCTKYGPYTVNAKVHPSLIDSAGTVPIVDVDLIGVNAATEHAMWSGVSPREYFKPGNARRKSADKATLQFRPGGPTQLTLKPTDPIWAKWKAASATEMFVFADLPPVEGAPPNADDGRRKVFNLKSKGWDKPIRIELRKDSVVVLDSPPQDD